jgi:hypothetical protein
LGAYNCPFIRIGFFNPAEFVAYENAILIDIAKEKRSIGKDTQSVPLVEHCKRELWFFMTARLLKMFAG